MDNEFSDKLQSIKDVLDAQKRQIVELDNAVKTLSASDMAGLEAELRECRDALKASELELKSAKIENKRLTEALYEQLFSEKANLLKSSQKYMELYFNKFDSEAEDNLFAFETSIRVRIEKIKGILKTEEIEDKENIWRQAKQLEESLETSIKKARDERREFIEEQLTLARAKYSTLAEKPLTDEQIKRRLKQNNVEALIGSKVVNIAGMFLILIGVILGLQYTYTTLIVSNPLKAAFAYLIGLVLVTSGELRNRNEKNPFSIGLTAGGIGILFAATAVSYFNLFVLSMYPALIICVLIAVLSFFLSVRYNSQTIGCFAIIGGYLPIFSLEPELYLVYSALVYFLLLNFLAIFIASKRKWSFMNLSSFILNSIGMFYLLVILMPRSNQIPSYISIPYVFASFAMYMALILVNPFFKRGVLSRADVVLLCLNTLLGGGFVYLLVYRNNITGLNGVFAIAFCLMYYIFGLVVDKKIMDKRMSGFYFITSLTFAILVAPLQLGRYYMALGWLVEGVALICYGVIKKDKKYERPGFLIFAFCIFAFLFLDLLSLPDTELLIRYLAVTSGSFIILAVYWHAITSEPVRFTRGIRRIIFIFSNIAAVNGWLFLCYLIAYIFHFNKGVIWWQLPVIATVTVFYAYFLSHIKLLKGKTAKYLPTVLYSISILLCITINGTYYYSQDLRWLALVLLAVFNILIILALWELLSVFVSVFEWIPLSVSAFTLFSAVQFLIVQFSLEFTSMIISFVCILFALVWIITGFRLRYPSMRRFGLMLTLVSVVKLFIFDLAFLNAWQRIVSFLGMGVVLVGISYVYRVIRKKES